MTPTLGDTLVRMRTALKIPQLQAAKDMNISQQNLSFYERDIKPPNIWKLVKFAEYYGLSTKRIISLFRRTYGYEPSGRGGNRLGKQINMTAQERSNIILGWTDKDRYDQTIGLRRKSI